MIWHFREMRLLWLHVAFTFIVKTFVLDFIQCRAFLSVVYRVRNAQSVFYTGDRILYPVRNP